MKGEIKHALDLFATDRRGFGRLLGTMGLTVSALPVLKPAYAAGGDLEVITWAGYELPKFHGAYIKKYGGLPEISFLVDEEDAMLKISHGFTADAAHIAMQALERWNAGGLLRPMDP